jgi:hypothetical protein
MAEEKILEEELLDETELENVAGGYYQTWNDRVNFIKLGGGFYKGDCKDGTFSATGVEKAFKKVGEYLGLNISAKCLYDDQKGKNPNKYYLDGKEISRDEMWSIIKEGYNANK